MLKIFRADDYILVKASEPHPANTAYRIAFGKEKWNKDVPVFKIQMVYNGKVSGRRSPSYPQGSDDYERVEKAMNYLYKRYNK
ncbi:hypothetical protein [Clostridium sp. BSD9I1]|uniref:hypothetical protein n=1 Tax=Clostridium sp. BSD9I1 TaxID=2003589 RepID=UPI00164909DC|nr:hypothetical protein [Clostridium sp. BSD9I1]